MLHRKREPHRRAAIDGGRGLELQLHLLAADEMVAALTARSGKMPKLAMFRTHNHYSEQMAIGTGDEQIEATLLDFVRGAVARRTI
jgi:hypothetical protein